MCRHLAVILILALTAIQTTVVSAGVTTAAGTSDGFTPAARAILKQAEQGNVKAQSQMGYLYYSGEGVPQSFVEAVKWYQKAATQGDMDAQYNLAVAYAFGEGVKQNFDQATAWYSRAAVQGHPVAQYSLGVSYAYGEGVAQDQKIASEWFLKSAKAGYMKAQVMVGSLYHTGEGLPKDYNQAAMWYRRAADQGDAAAQYNLGTLYRAGKGVEKNLDEARKLFQMSADQGYEAAQKELSSMERSIAGTKRETAVAPPSTAQVTLPAAPVTPAATVATAPTVPKTPVPSPKPVPAQSAPPAPPAQTVAKDSGTTGPPPAAPAPVAQGKEGGFLAGMKKFFTPAPATGTTPNPLASPAQAVTNTPGKAPDKIVTPEKPRAPDVAQTNAPPVVSTPVKDEKPAAAAKEAARPVPLTAVAAQRPAPVVAKAPEPQAPETVKKDVPPTVKTPSTTPDKKEEKQTGFLAGVKKFFSPDPSATSTPNPLAASSTPTTTTPGKTAGNVPLKIVTPEKPRAPGIAQANVAPASAPAPASEVKPAASAKESSRPAPLTAVATQQVVTPLQKNVPQVAARDNVQPPAAASGTADKQGKPASLPKDTTRAVPLTAVAAQQPAPAVKTPEQKPLPDSTVKGPGAQGAPAGSTALKTKEVEKDSGFMDGIKKLFDSDSDSGTTPHPLATALPPPRKEPATKKAPDNLAGKIVTPEKPRAQDTAPGNAPAVSALNKDTKSETGPKNITGTAPVPNTTPAVKSAPGQGTVSSQPIPQKSVAPSRSQTPGNQTDSTTSGPATSKPLTVAKTQTATASIKPDITHKTVTPWSTPGQEKSAAKNAGATQPLPGKPAAEKEVTPSKTPEKTTEKTTASAKNSIAAAPAPAAGAAPTNKSQTPATGPSVKPEQQALPPWQTGATDKTISEQDKKNQESLISNVKKFFTYDPDEKITPTPNPLATTPASTAARKSTTQEKTSAPDGAEPDTSSATVSLDKKLKITPNAGQQEIYRTAPASAKPADAPKPEAERAGAPAIDKTAQKKPADAEEPAAIAYAEGTAPSIQSLVDDPEKDTVAAEPKPAANRTQPSGPDQQSSPAPSTTTTKPAAPEKSAAAVTTPPATGNADPSLVVAKVDPEKQPDTPVATAAEKKLQTESFNSLTSRAVEGDAGAQYQLAQHYYTGDQVNQDYGQAFLWYRRASQQGHVESQYKLGNMYLMGEGVKQSDANAMQWYEKAAAQGHGAARNNLENLQRITRTQEPAGETASATAAKPTPEKAKPEAQVEEEDKAKEKGGVLGYLGRIFKSEDQTDKTASDPAPATAQNPLQTSPQVSSQAPPTPASSAGHAPEVTRPSEPVPGQLEYEKGVAYSEGSGIAQSDSNAFELFQSAAEQNYVPAQYQLGNAYMGGRGTEKNMDNAMVWYEKAARQGYAPAQRTLANLYQKGDASIKPNKVLALAWYNILATSGNVLDVHRRDALKKELSAAEVQEAEKLKQQLSAGQPRASASN